MRKWTPGLLLILYLAGLGYLLVTVPPWLVTQLRELEEAGWGRGWVTLYLAALATGGLLLLSVTVWLGWLLWRRTRLRVVRDDRLARSPGQLSAEEKREEIREHLDEAERLRDDTEVPAEMRRELEPLIQRVLDKQERRRLEIVAFGTISSGKSALLNALAGRDVFQTDPKGGTTVRRNEIPWGGQDEIVLVDTPGLGEIEGERHQALAAEAARDADLILLVIDGPLRDSEFALVRMLGRMEKRLVVCLNKSDWYEQAERRTLVAQVADQLQGLVRREDIVVVQAQATERTRVRVGADGEPRAEIIEQPPDLSGLAEHMMQIVAQDGRDLLLGNLLLQSRGMIQQARLKVTKALDRRAWQIVDRYMWAAGGAAAVSPLPLLDLAAGGALTVKMVVDLARVYHRQVDLETITRLLGQLGKNLIAILGVRAVGPAVTAAVASMLKTVPGIGTIAGGVLQGVVQALITRWIGGVFIAYYRQDMQETGSSLAELARDEWEQVTQLRELTRIVKQSRQRLAAADPEEGTHD